MCFSTEASFTAALVLGAAGGVTIKNSSSTSYFFLAAIPMLFALQQLSEGFVWLHFTEKLGSGNLFFNAEKAFLMFAFLIWPIWIPLALAAVEPHPYRRFLLYLNLGCGMILSLMNFSYGFQQEITVRVVNHSLQYGGQIPPQTYVYPLIVLLPCFISSLKNVWVFGSLVTISYFAAEYFYSTTFVSVWCFFAALVSLSVIKIIKDNQQLPEKEKTRF